MIQAKLYFDRELPSAGAGITPGIHANGDIQYLGIEKADTSWDVRFGNVQGQFVRKRLFEPNANYMNEGETPADALQRSIDKNVGVLVDIMRAVVGEAAKGVEAETYEEFVTKVADELKPYEGTPVCLKVVPETRNDKTYGKVPDYNFIDSYVPGFPTTLYWKKKEKELMAKHGHIIE